MAKQRRNELQGNWDFRTSNNELILLHREFELAINNRNVGCNNIVNVIVENFQTSELEH